MKFANIKNVLKASLLAGLVCLPLGVFAQQQQLQEPQGAPDLSAFTFNKAKAAVNTKLDPKSFDTKDLRKTIVDQKSRMGGVVNGGGGDSFVLDYLKAATQDIYPFLQAKEQIGRVPKGLADDFLSSVNAVRITTAEHVFESCDGTNRGREVEACYNSRVDILVLSRSRFPRESNAAQVNELKRQIIVHEQFRRMGYEGDDYQLSRLIDGIFKEYNPLYIYTKEPIQENVDGSYTIKEILYARGNKVYSIFYNSDQGSLNYLCQALKFRGAVPGAAERARVSYREAAYFKVNSLGLEFAQILKGDNAEYVSSLTCYR